MKNLVFLLFVILSAAVTAQNSFTPGYVVSAEGDTIRGLILEQSDFEMSRKFIFKTSEGADIRKYTTKQLAGFGFDSGREFETRILLPKDGDLDTTFIFAKKVLSGEIDVFVGKRFQKGQPEIFLDNKSNISSIQLYRSRQAEALGLKEFLALLSNDPNSLKNPQPVTFNENNLLKNIAIHNDTVKSNYPLSVYREKIEKNLDLLVGLPVDYSKAALHFRGAVYLNRTRIERNSNISLLHGIIYHHWEGKEINNTESLSQGDINKKWQLINIMPIGIKFHGNSGIFRPYGYIGAGAAALRETNIIGGEDQLRWKFIPTINSGIGVRIQIGKNHLITELTPTINNLFLNIGWSF